MGERVSERSFYAPLIKVLEQFNIKAAQEIEITYKGVKFPDLEAYIDGEKIIVEVKIDTEYKLSEAIVDAHRKAMLVDATGMIAILLPSEARQLKPEILPDIAPKIRFAQALILLPWYTDQLRNKDFYDLAKILREKYDEYVKTRVPIVSFDLIVNVARDVISDLALILRKHFGMKKLSDMAMWIVGRFDIYKAMLEEFEVSEEEMRIWIADIMAYILINQILFYHIISKKLKKDPLPSVNPLSPPMDLLDKVAMLMKEVSKEYPRILGSAPHICNILREINDPRIIYVIARFIDTIYALKPENVKEELLGRLYHESIPPETRKNLGAFYTNPIAAKLLANLAIDKWDEKVLDPACGSGTLLVEAYHAKLRKAPKNIPKEELHKRFLEEDIRGIDIMHFAMHMTSINLTAQGFALDALAKAEPKVHAGDGIEAMIIYTKGNDPPVTTLKRWLSYVSTESLSLPRNYFDVVIMNPPFTRRERIPEVERKKLEKWFKGIVRGKVGYWTYFVAAADSVLKNNGKLAIVMPEEFFVGGWAESLRRYLFLGERYDEKSSDYIKKLNRVYNLRYIVRSAVQIAFSEGARYRDYLIVFKKSLNVETDPLIFIVLKKKLEEISENDALKIISTIKEFEKTNQDVITTPDFDLRKVYNIGSLVKRHIGNLKPIVGLSSLKAQELIHTFLDSVAENPTLKELEDKGVLEIRLYRPGQKAKGVEGIVQKLIVARYGERSPYLTFRLEREERDIVIKPHVKKLKGINVKIPRDKTIKVLWTHAAVPHMDVTDEEEYGIANYKVVLENELLKSMFTALDVKKAINDLETAYEDYSSHILLARRVRLTSPNTYWLTFFSRNKVLGIQLPNIKLHHDIESNKILTLYLNSSITLLQLLAFVAEVEGAWVSIDHGRVWGQIHVPDILNLPNSIRNASLKLFNKVAKLKVNCLYERIRTKDKVQKEIDVTVLKMLGLNQWINRLDEIYDAILDELNAMQRILKQPKKNRKVKKH